MRKVKYFNYKLDVGASESRKIEIGEAWFHAFGMLENNSSAIIEQPDGSIKNIYVELIQFITPTTGDL